MFHLAWVLTTASLRIGAIVYACLLIISASDKAMNELRTQLTSKQVTCLEQFVNNAGVRFRNELLKLKNQKLAAAQPDSFLGAFAPQNAWASSNDEPQPRKRRIEFARSNNGFRF